MTAQVLEGGPKERSWGCVSWRCERVRGVIWTYRFSWQDEETEE